MSQADIQSTLPDPHSSAEVQTELEQELHNAESVAGHPGPATVEPLQRIPTANWRLRAERFYYILKYYRISQIASRGYRLIRKRLGRFSSARTATSHNGHVPRLNELTAIRELTLSKLNSRNPQIARENVERIVDGRFEFLNREERLPSPVDWNLDTIPDCPHLWKFHLHYQEYLLDFAAAAMQTGDDFYSIKAWQIVEDWINDNPHAHPESASTAWHPFCISRRLPVWMLLWSVSPPADEDSRREVLHSIDTQAKHLERHLEWDLRGNHLLENVRALAYCGMFFEGRDANRRLDKCEQILRRELPEQVLPHGEHFERSPMYHVRMLEVLREIQDLTERKQPTLSSLCESQTSKMESFLQEIIHPDGEIPLFGDSSFGESPASAVSMEAFAKNQPQGSQGSANTAGSYWIWRSGNDALIFDAGPVGADHLPAHAHSDLLTLEASVNGQRLFVDSGVFDYGDGRMRQYCRSTAAHNVLQIDETEQCDTWSRFRMGYRGHPSKLQTGNTNGWHWAFATHNAYRRAGVPVVGRWIACRDGGPWFCVDRAGGNGSHKITNRLHLHPDVEATRTDHNCIRLLIAEKEYVLEFLSPGSVPLKTGWYCPEFGLRIPAPVICWEETETLPIACGWMLRPAECTGEAELRSNSNRNLTLRWKEDGHHTGHTFMIP